MSCFNEVACYRTGWQVQVEAGMDAGTIQFTLMPGCDWLKDPCRMKAIMASVAKYMLEQAVLDEVITAECCDRCECALLNDKFTFYQSMRALVFETALPAPASPVMYNVAPGCVVTLA